MATVTNAQKMRWEAAVQEVKILKAQREMVYRWLREPDYIQNANTEWMVNWLGRRPIAECSPRPSLTELVAEQPVPAPTDDCPYGQCRCRNLCKGSHCVREAMERSGYELIDGEFVEKPRPAHS